MELDKITSVCLVLRPGQKNALALASDISEWFAGSGVEAWLAERNPHGEPCCLSGPSRPDLVLVLGGDGTMLGALRSVIGTNIPVLGINLGQVGFLASIAEENWRNELEIALSIGLDLRRCLVLDWRIERDGKIIEQGRAINDVVLRCGNLAKLVELRLHINREDAGALRADGLVIATPTGSSGYAFSAGGPLVYPEVEAFVLTPICPFLNRMPPFIIGSDKMVWLDVAPKYAGIFLTADGQEGFPLEPGDRICITRSRSRAFIASLPQSSYFAVLRDRGFIRDP